MILRSTLTIILIVIVTVIKHVNNSPLLLGDLLGGPLVELLDARRPVPGRPSPTIIIIISSSSSSSIIIISSVLVFYYNYYYHHYYYY